MRYCVSLDLTVYAFYVALHVRTALLPGSRLHLFRDYRCVTVPFCVYVLPLLVATRLRPIPVVIVDSYLRRCLCLLLLRYCLLPLPDCYAVLFITAFTLYYRSRLRLRYRYLRTRTPAFALPLLRFTVTVTLRLVRCLIPRLPRLFSTVTLHLLRMPVTALRTPPAWPAFHRTLFRFTFTAFCSGYCYHPLQYIRVAGSLITLPDVLFVLPHLPVPTPPTRALLRFAYAFHLYPDY